MSKLLALFLCLLLASTAACLAKHKAQDDCQPADSAEDKSAAVTKPAGAVPGSQDAPAGDVNNALDKMLSQPACTSPQSVDQAAQPQPVATPSSTPPVAVTPPKAEASPVDPTQFGVKTISAGTLKGQAQINAKGRGGNAGCAPDAFPLKDRRDALQGEAGNDSMQLQAEKDDPDAGDQQLMVEWDLWRNRFLRAVQMQVQANINNPDASFRRRRRFDPYTGGFSLPFPLGTIAWFRCRITADRRIVDLELVESSGFPDYDRAVLSGIQALEGTSLLQYPPGSHRTIVHQAAGIETAARPDNRYFNFGDVERYSTPKPRNDY
jgi:hypothetical protein